MANVGTAYVDVLPEMKNFGKTLTRDITKSAQNAGQSAGKTVSNEMTNSIRTSNRRLVDSGTRVGRDYGRQFSGAASEETRRGNRRMADEHARAAGSNGKAAGGRFGKAFGGAGLSAVKGFAAGFAGLFAIEKIASFIGDSIAQATESNKVAAQTANVLKTTGSAAKVTAKQVADLSTAISNKTGIDDEAIQSGANLILTFTNIRNEVGKGNNIFDQSVGIITDMSAALKQDLKSSAIQVGKALNDPIKGMTALRRVGVTFNQQQIDTVKHLVDTGQKMAAQKLILAELKKEFGGSAEAMATPAEKAAVAWGNFKENVGNILLPLVNKFANFANTTLIPALQKVVAFLKTPFGKQVGMVVTITLAAVAVGVLTAAVWGLTAALLANPITWIVGLIVALGAAFVLAYMKIKAFHNFVNFAWNNLATISKWLWYSVLQPVFQAIAKGATWLWKNVIQPMAAGIAWEWKFVIAPAIRWLWYNVIQPVFQFIAKAATWLWINAIRPAFKNITDFFKTVVAPTVKWLWVNIIQPYFNAIATAATWLWVHAIGPAFRLIWGYIKNTLAPAFTWLWQHIVQPAMRIIANSVTSGWKLMKPAFDLLVDIVKNKIPSAFRAARDAIKTIWNAIGGIVKAPIKFVVQTVWNGAMGGLWNTVKKVVPGLPGFPSASLPKGFATGGIYPGYTPGRDVGYIGVSGGEAIMRPEWTRAVGSDYVNAGNRAARTGGVDGVRRFMGGFDGGGIVGFVDKLTNILPGTSIAKGAAKSALSAGGPALANYGKGVVHKIINSMTSAFGGGSIAKMGSGVGTTLADAAINYLAGKAGDSGSTGDAANVIAEAKKHVGKVPGPEGSDYSNIFTRAFGMDGSPWCAMFQSSVFKKAAAGAGIWSASVADWEASSKFKHVKESQMQPGDLRTYGPGDHINLYIGNGQTIGGNESDAVRMQALAAHANAANILRPSYKIGGGGAAGGKMSGGSNAIFTSFWDPQTATGHMTEDTIASSYLPLGSKVKVGIGGKSETGVIRDFGPAKFVYDRHPGEAVLDLNSHMAQRLTGSSDIVTSGQWQLLNEGSGGTLYGKRLRGYMKGGIANIMGQDRSWSSRNGLEKAFDKGGYSNHHPMLFDSGGYLPADSMFNKTGKPEPVFTSDQHRRLERLVQYVDRQEATGGHQGDVVIVTQSDDPYTIWRLAQNEKNRTRTTGTVSPIPRTGR